MSIATAITNAQQRVANAYTAVDNKGGTLPATQNLSNLPTAISSIHTGGVIPTGTINITTNGTYNVTNYASANVNVSGGGGSVGIPREVSQSGVFQMPSSSFIFSLPSNATDLGDYSLYYALRDCTGLTEVDLSSLTYANGNQCFGYAFYGCSNLITVDLSNLTTISGDSAFTHAFYNCTNLTTVDLSSLTTINGVVYVMNYAFTGCTSLTSVDLSSLTTISGGSAMDNAFSRCTSLTSINFQRLSRLSGASAFNNAFYNCTNITTISFPALTSTSFGAQNNVFHNMVRNVTGCTVHFPSNLQSVIGSWSDVTAGFGGTNTVVLFDLPATT